MNNHHVGIAIPFFGAAFLAAAHYMDFYPPPRPDVFNCEQVKCIQVKKQEVESIAFQLWEAVGQRDLDELDTLITTGLTPEQKSDGLLAATMHRNADALKSMLDAGANPNAPNGIPLSSVSAFDCLKCVEVLLNAGADIHFGDDAALYNAVQSGRYHIVKFLLESGANSNARGGTLYGIATQNGHSPTANLLRNYSPKFTH